MDPPDSGVRHISDHPLARHRKAGPQTRVTADEALEAARPHFPDIGWWLSVRPGEEYRDKLTYSPPPVPLEEVWVVRGGMESMLDGTAVIVGVSRRTGEVLFHSSFPDGG